MLEGGPRYEMILDKSRDTANKEKLHNSTNRDLSLLLLNLPMLLLQGSNSRSDKHRHPWLRGKAKLRSRLTLNQYPHSHTPYRQNQPRIPNISQSTPKMKGTPTKRNHSSSPAHRNCHCNQPHRSPQGKGNQNKHSSNQHRSPKVEILVNFCQAKAVLLPPHSSSNNNINGMRFVRSRIQTQTANKMTREAECLGNGSNLCSSIDTHGMTDVTPLPPWLCSLRLRL